jgi:hypothetical protein
MIEVLAAAMAAVFRKSRRVFPWFLEWVVISLNQKLVSAACQSSEEYRGLGGLFQTLSDILSINITVVS